MYINAAYKIQQKYYMDYGWGYWTLVLTAYTVSDSDWMLNGKGGGNLLLNIFRFLGEKSGVSAKEEGCIPFNQED